MKQVDKVVKTCGLLGEVWNNCAVVYSNGHVSDNIGEKVIDDIKKYINIFPYSKKDTIWFDLKEYKYFSGSQFREGPAGKEHNFCSDDIEFLDSKWGNIFVNNIIQDIDVFKNQEIVRTQECIYSNPHYLKKYEGKSILIVSGGPSTADVGWENIKTDFVWSCNHFFLDPKFENIDVDLVTLANNVDFLENKKLKSYLSNKKTKVAFEIERGDHLVDYENMKKFIFNNPEICSFFHTRYRGNPGVSLRLLCYAIFLAPKNIYFVGIDGFKKETQAHAFELNKNNPNWFQRYGSRFQDRQFVAYWDYILKLRDVYKFDLYNLGEDHPYNVSSEISKKHFPLSKEIKERI